MCWPRSSQTKALHRAAAVRGFSLVELLVVIGVIALLIGVLIPTLRRAREQASQTQCASQLHQLGIALGAYAADHQGWLPTWSGWHTYPPAGPEDEVGVAWTMQLAPYIGLPNSAVYSCPSFHGPRWVNYFLSGRWSASQGRHSMRLAEVRFSPQFVLGGEDTDRHMYAPPVGDALNHTTNDIDQDDANSPCSAFPGEDGGFMAHPGGNHILFGDLHVRAMHRYDAAAMTFAANAMRSWEDVLPAMPPDVRNR